MFSPTFITESVLITTALEAHEVQDMATLDIPRAYIHTEMDEDVIIFLEGALYEIMVKVVPKIYRKCVIMSRKGKPLLYVKMKKALYGLLRSALLFHRKLVNDLEACGFHINLNDPCMAHNMIKESDDGNMACGLIKGVTFRHL